MFADDIVLIGRNLEEIYNRLYEWRLVLECKGLRISRSKTKYIENEFGGRDQEVDGARRAINGDIIGEVESFKYLGS